MEVKRIGLNATCIGPRPSGARNRFLGLYRNVIPMMPNTEFIIYNPSDYRVSENFKEHPNIRQRDTGLTSSTPISRFVGGLSYWEKATLEDNVEIFEVFHLPFVQCIYGKAFLTIHDLRCLKFDWLTPRSYVLREIINRVIERSILIITVSHSIKNELLSAFPDADVEVIHNAIEAKDYARIGPDDVSNIVKRYNLTTEFVLAVGHLETRKNYRNLIEAIGLLRHRGVVICLVIVGYDAGAGRKLKALINGLNLGGQVILLNGVPDYDLRVLYKTALTFVFPSMYEGFGIPILEAMAGGCPLVLSDIPVFREIAGDAALYFDGSDIQDMASKIEESLCADEVRDRITIRGLTRVEDFSFVKAAAKLKELYTRY